VASNLAGHSREESAPTTNPTGFAKPSAIAHYAVNNRARCRCGPQSPGIAWSFKKKAELDNVLKIPKLWRRNK
jgi:hypothetical protein